MSQEAGIERTPTVRSSGVGRWYRGRVLQQMSQGKQVRASEMGQRRNRLRLVVPGRRVVGHRVAAVRDMDIRQFPVVFGAVSVAGLSHDVGGTTCIHERAGGRHAEVEQHDRENEAQDDRMHPRIL